MDRLYKYLSLTQDWKSFDISIVVYLILMEFPVFLDLLSETRKTSFLFSVSSLDTLLSAISTHYNYNWKWNKIACSNDLKWVGFFFVSELGSVFDFPNFIVKNWLMKRVLK